MSPKKQAKQTQLQVQELESGFQFYKEEDRLLYENFMNSLKSDATKENYARMLKYYLQFLGKNTTHKQYSALLDPDKGSEMVEKEVKAFLVSLRKKGLSYQSAKQYLNPIKKFYRVNNWKLYSGINWEVVNDFLGDDDDKLTDEDIERGVENKKRPYRLEEIQKMLKDSNSSRTKIMILLIASCGVRIGGIAGLKVRDLQKKKVVRPDNHQEEEIYQIWVYRTSKKANYITYCTPECTEEIDNYLDY